MFAGESFLDVARKLADADTEADWRSAVSRAYYAAFWAARSAVEAGGVGVAYSGGEGSHDALWNMLVTEYNAIGDSLGETGRRLKLARVRADYRDRTVTADDARRAVRNAGQLVADLRALT